MNFLSLAFTLLLSTTPPLAPDAASALCVPRAQLAGLSRCVPMPEVSSIGPGAYAAQVAAARLPAPLPELPTYRLPRYDPLVEYAYARVSTSDAPLFASPEEAAAGTVKRSIGAGFLYVTLNGPLDAGGQSIYQIRTGEYIRASDVRAVTPTRFQGLGFEANPERAFGWIIANVRPSRVPGEVPDKNVPRLPRRQVVQIYATQKVGPWNWFLIGENQWLEQRAIAKVDIYPPPAGVSGKWISVNLYEQTLAAFEDNRLVYATLVSSGLDKWPTRPGVFQVWARLRQDGMRGSYEADGSDFYSLEAVPWVLYFDGARALHGEYWHDRLGFKRSHGCVNLAPQDAHWLYDWAEKGTTVWVYDPSGQTPTDVEDGGAP